MAITRTTRIAGLLALLAGFGASEAAAQFYPRPFVYGGYYSYSGPIVIPEPRRPVGSSVAHIFEDLRDQGFRSLTLSGRRPDVLVVDAIAPNRQPVRLIVDAYDGEILERYARQAAAPLAPRGPGSLGPDIRAPREAPPGTGGFMAEPRSSRSTEVGNGTATPLPPRRQDNVAQGPNNAAPAIGSPNAARPAPVAPARDPSLWAPNKSQIGTTQP